MGNMLDITRNRKERKYTNIELLKRVLWDLVKPMFRFSPRTSFRWRNYLLRLFGAQIGHNVHIYNTAVIYMPWNLKIGNWSSIGEYAFVYNLGKITVGSQSTVSQRAHLCAGTHDYTKPELPLIRSEINIGDKTWICADAFIGPGVSISEGAVVGARAVAVKDVSPWTVVAGNPASFIKTREMKSEK